MFNFSYTDPVFGFTTSGYAVPENAGPAQGAVTITNDVILTFDYTVRVNIVGGTATGGACITTLVLLCCILAFHEP